MRRFDARHGAKDLRLAIVGSSSRLRGRNGRRIRGCQAAAQGSLALQGSSQLGLCVVALRAHPLQVGSELGDLRLQRGGRGGAGVAGRVRGSRGGSGRVHRRLGARGRVRAATRGERRRSEGQNGRNSRHATIIDFRRNRYNEGALAEEGTLGMP